MLAPFRRLARHPVRTGLAIALAVLGVVAGRAIGVTVWDRQALISARRAADLGHTAEALAYFGRCVSVSPDAREVLLLQARIARRGGAWSEAARRLDRYWQLYGDDEPLGLEQTLLRAATGDVDAVRPALLARIEHQPADAPPSRETLEAIVSGLLYRLRLDEAEPLIDRWLARVPDDPVALMLRGKLFEFREQTSNALAPFRRALELDPGYDEVRLRLTTLLCEFSQADEALGHLRYLRARLPENPLVLVQTGQALDLQGRAADAAAILDECLRRHPRHAGALELRGRIARRDGDATLAEQCLGLAVRVDPGNIAARYQLYQLLLQNGKPDDAAREHAVLKRAEDDLRAIDELVRNRLPQSPSDPGVPSEIGMICLRAGRPREALRWFTQALKLDPDHVPSHRALAAFYHETGNPILANRHRALAGRAGPDRTP